MADEQEAPAGNIGLADEQAAPAGNIGLAISQKIGEAIQKMNVIDSLKGIISTDSEDPESLEVKKRLEGIIEKYMAMSDDEKESFQAQVKETLTSKLAMKFESSLGGLQDQIQSAIALRLGLVAVGFIVLVVLVVFFGYKLYKSIRDKELKREEKKKAKQLKKKK